MVGVARTSVVRRDLFSPLSKPPLPPTKSGSGSKGGSEDWTGEGPRVSGRVGES